MDPDVNDEIQMLMSNHSLEDRPLASSSFMMAAWKVTSAFLSEIFRELVRE